MKYSQAAITGAIASVSLSLISIPVSAQLIPDGTLGLESSVVNQIDVNRQEIAGGAQRLSSLFHSFQEFGVPAGKEVYFVPNTPVLNIFTRVTGNNTSEILGKLGVDGSSNLFLINPNGIHFGTDASLDISGSFTASTAERFEFADGTEFSAINPQNAPLLTVHSYDPIAHYGIEQATMIVDGNLVAGDNLHLGSATLQISGNLQAERDIILQGNNRDLSNGNYTVGGYLFTRNIAGNLLDFVVPHPNVIWGDGDVRLNADYDGNSLYILASGSISAAPEVSSITINDGEASTVNSLLIDSQTITVSSDGKPHIDIRSSVDYLNFVRGDLGESSEFRNVTTGDIELENIRISNAGGDVVIISAVEPNSLLQSGNINLQEVYTGVFSGQNFGGEVIGGHSGKLFVSSIQGNISIDQISSRSNTFSSSSFSYTSRDVEGGNGGIISVSSDVGDISIENLDSSSFSVSGSLENTAVAGDVFGGNGGSIFFTTNQGNIIIEELDTSSISASVAGINADFEQGSGSVTGGLGGSVFLSASTGNILIGNVDARSRSLSVSSGLAFFQNDLTVFGNQGGDVFISTINGDITTENLESSSISAFSNRGDIQGSDAGQINVSTINGNIITGLLDSSSQTSARAGNLEGGNGLDITLSSETGSITTGNKVNSWSYTNAESVNSVTVPGSAGDINLIAKEGRLISQGETFLQAFATSSNGQIGADGGSVRLMGNGILSDYRILTQSASSKSGDISIVGNRNLIVDRLSLLVSQTVEVPNPFSSETSPREPITFSVGQTGQSGDVSIAGNEDLSLRNTIIQSSTQNSNSAGNIFLSSQGLLTIQEDTRLSSNSQNSGKAGDFYLNSDTGILITGTDTELTARASDIGSAGNFALTAPTITINDNATLSTSTNNDGNAGTIFIDAETLNLRNGGQILSDSNGSGNGGLIRINAIKSVNLEKIGTAPIISVETSNSGKAGNIEINTPKFTLSETARITATATKTATNPEGGGSITISADQMNLAGVVGIFAETQGNAPAGRLLLKPYQNNPNLDIDLFAGSKISAATSGSGNGGDLIVTAPNNIDISGAGILSVETSSSGNAGTISVTSNNLALRDGVTLSASTAGSGNGGFIKFTVAGDINIFDSFVKAITTENSTGKGGSIDIDPINTNLINSRVAVDSQGEGIGGNIFVTSDFLNLDNSAIATETFSSDGGNLFLNIGTWLTLKNGSNITATAGFAKRAGNGGNISIFSPIISSPLDQDNNIRAEAFEGTGGNIFIRTIALSGLDFTGVDIPVRNDITASSTIGIDGNVTIDRETTAVEELPAPLVDADSLIGKDACAIDNNKIAGGSTFVIQGQGGLPTMPEGNVNIRTPILSYLANPDNVQAIAPTTPASTTPKNNEFAIAQGWQRYPDGTIKLTSSQHQARQDFASHPSCLTQEG